MPYALGVLSLLIIMPYVLAISGGIAKRITCSTLDLHYPRLQDQKLEGLPARLVAAQANAWESLIFYSAILLALHLKQTDLNTVATPAIIFAISRLLHPLFYIANIAVVRSMVFGIGFLSALSMLYIGLIN